VSDVPERDAPPAASLAAQAAAWVPPWAREAPAEAELTEPAEPTQPEVEGSAEPEAEALAERASADQAPAEAEPTGYPAPAEPEQIDQPEPADLPEGSDEAEPADEVEPVELVEQAEPAQPAEWSEGAEAGVSAEPSPPAEEPLDESGAAEPFTMDELVAELAADEVAEAEAATESLTPVPVVELRPALEAILLVVDEPVTELLLAQVLEQPVEAVAAELAALAGEYTAHGRGFELRRAAGGWRLYTRPEYAAHVERFVLDGQSVRLTQAALETLAVVAYKQPVTRSRISAIRGVNCDGVVRTLVTRGLIEESGTEPETGAYLYRTSNLFLEKLGLDSVDQLPPLAPFLPDNVDEIAGDVGR
jgi:segregation and condensation protein B